MDAHHNSSKLQMVPNSEVISDGLNSQINESRQMRNQIFCKVGGPNDTSDRVQTLATYEGTCKLVLIQNKKNYNGITKRMS